MSLDQNNHDHLLVKTIFTILLRSSRFSVAHRCVMVIIFPIELTEMRLRSCEECFNRSYGENLERLNSVKASQEPKLFDKYFVL